MIYLSDMSESEIQRSIIDYCTAKGALVFRMNSGHSGRHNVKLHPPGTPDLFVVKKPVAIWIEVKTAKGKVSEIQHKMHERLTDLGQVVIVARSSDDVKGLI